MEIDDPPHAVARRPSRLVGRDRELDRFRRLVASGGRGVVLAGPAGVGKTRLAAALCDLGLGHVSRFVRARGSTADVPLAPFAPLLGSALGVGPLSEPSDREHAASAAPVLSPGSSATVSTLVTARRAIESLGVGGEVVLGVDDAHLLDPTSASLVHQLVGAGSVVLVATIREERSAPAPIVDLWRSGLVERWVIEPLGADDARRVVAELMGDEPDLAAIDEIARLGGGNPLHLGVLVQAWRERDRSPSSLAASSSLGELVERELSQVSPEVRDALGIVALAEPIGVDLLDGLVDAATLREAERSGWLDVVTDGRRVDVRLAHPLFGEVLRRRVSRLLVRSVLAELARRIEAHGARRRDDRVRVTTWLVESGGSPDPTSALIAAEEAFDRGDLALAGRLAEVSWLGDDGAAAFRAGLLLAASRAPVLRERPEEVIRRLVELARTDDDRARLAVGASYGEVGRHGDPMTAMPAIDLILRSLPSGTGPHRSAEGHRACLLAMIGRFDAARSIVDRLLDELGDDAFAYVAPAVEAVAGVTGEDWDVAHRLVRWVDAAPDARHDLGAFRVTRAGMTPGIAWWLAQRGDLAGAERWAARAVADEPSDVSTGHRAQTELARVWSFQGDALRARDLARRAAGLQHRLGLRWLARTSRLVEALAAANAGDVEGATVALAEADRLPAGTSVTVASLDWFTRSVVHELRGDAEAALRWAERGVEIAAVTGASCDEALAWLSVAWFAPPRPDVDEVFARLRACGGAARIHVQYADARWSGDPSAIAAAGEQYGAAGMVGMAGMVVDQAARLAASSGDERSASRWSRRAVELQRPTSVGGVFAAMALAEPLSVREREVAELAAGGRSNREIADELFLAVRTVENHLARVFTKLGVDGRDQLGAAFADLAERERTVG